MRNVLAFCALAAAAFIAVTELPSRVVAQSISEMDRTVLHAEIRNYLLANPEILREMIALLDVQTQEETATRDRDLVAAHSDAIFDDGFSWVGGNPEGSFTVVEFLDYQCGFCRRAHPELMELIAEDGDIRWIVKEMPILGPGSQLASRAAIATLVSEGPEAYGRLVDGLLRMQGPIDDIVLDDVLAEARLDPATIRIAMEDPEVTRRQQETRALAQTLSISGTPTFVFGEQMVRGYLPLDQMRLLLAELRAED
jgi:protein-disulfide isomerase